VHGIKRRNAQTLLLARLPSPLGVNERVNEFYKKGCQEKKLRLDRSRDLFLEIQPTVVFASDGMKPNDLLTFVLVSSVLITVTFFASYVPARHATKIDPMQTLRHE
jgi:hypothetical protein